MKNNNFHYNKGNNYKRYSGYNNNVDNEIKKALEENKRLKMELNQKNNVLKDYNARIRILQEELYKDGKQKNIKPNNSERNTNNYPISSNNFFPNENPFNSRIQNDNLLHIFLDNIFPNRNIRVINSNFNPGDYEDFYEDKNINNPFHNHINFNNINDDSKVEQDIIEQLYPDPDKMTYEELLELEEKVGNVSKGLNKAQIKKIPRFIYQKNKHKNIESKCVVCQYEFKNGDNITKLTCGHVFHTDCVDTWLSKNKVCPMCHKEIVIN